MVSLAGKETIITVENRNHWMTKSSVKLDKTISSRDFAHHRNTVQVVSLFENANDPDVIINYFKKLRNSHVNHIAKSSEGIFASMECKTSPLEIAISKIVSETFSRIWTRSHPDNLITIAIQYPWKIEVEEIALKILEKYKLKTQPEVIINDIDMLVPTPSENTLLAIDDLDKRIGKTLLMNGYFVTPRPKGVTQQLMCEKLDISKPTLEDRLRKIESIGITQLLGIRGFTETEVDASWKVLQKIRSQK